MTGQTVLFDASGTLVTMRMPISDLVLAADGRLSPDAVRESLKALGRDGLWPDDENDPARRHRNWADFLALAVTRAGGVPDGPACDDGAAAILDPRNYVAYPDAVPCLTALRQDARVGSIGLVSNFDPWLRDILDLLGLTGFFDQLFISGETGLVKPDGKAVEHALDVLGVAAADSMLVGDSIGVDVTAAIAAGVRPVLIDRGGTQAAPTITVIKDLRELPALVGGTR